MLESYTNILEKKVNNLKKENKELQEILHNGNDSCSFEKADTIMNQIFNLEKPTKVDEPSIISISVGNVESVGNRNIKKDVNNDTKIIINDDKKKPLEISEMPEDISDVVSDILPVAKHIEIPDEVEKDIEIESVVSENSNVYNRKKLNKMNLDKIKEICTSMNLSTDGTKNTLIDKILSQ